MSNQDEITKALDALFTEHPCSVQHHMSSSGQDTFSISFADLQRSFMFDTKTNKYLGNIAYAEPVPEPGYYQEAPQQQSQTSAPQDMLSLMQSLMYGPQPYGTSPSKIFLGLPSPEQDPAIAAQAEIVEKLRRRFG